MSENKTVAKHSQLPWRECADENSSCPCGMLYDASGDCVVLVVHSEQHKNYLGDPWPNDHVFNANLRFVVTACNNHYQLAEAIIAVRRDHQLNGVECCCKPGVAAKCIVCTVEAAISKAVPND